MKTTRHFRAGLSYFFIIVIHLIHFFNDFCLNFARELKNADSRMLAVERSELC